MKSGLVLVLRVHDNFIQTDKGNGVQFECVILLL